MLLIYNIGKLYTLDDSVGGELGEITDASVIINNQDIFWCGKKELAPKLNFSQKIDANGAMVIPGFVDCHSHLIFAGTRADEFSRRMNNESYEEIVKKGGGIVNTVKATRAASDEELYALAYGRASKILLKGTTTLEVKSGYGLSMADELRILNLISCINKDHPIDLHPTFLGAHIIPNEYKDRPSEYVDLVAGPLLQKIRAQDLAIDCDVFCENGAFTVDDAHKILSCAQELGFGLRAHVQQLSHSGGVSLLKELSLKSISHADFLSDQDVELIRAKNTVVEALPFAALFVRSKAHTPVEKLLKASVPLAIATDFNPGTAMCYDIVLAAKLAIVYSGFSLEAALKGITKVAARSLGRNNIGEIKKGNKADILITNSKDVKEFFYDWTADLLSIIIKNGKVITAL